MTNPAGQSGETRPRNRANRRGAARLAAVQALYQMEIGGTNLTEVIAEFESFRLGKELDGDQYREADADWFRDLVGGVVAEQRVIDPVINAALVADWPLKRIDATLRAILRAGVYELQQRRDVPARAVLSEYIDVAKAFFTDDEPRIVNGVLDRIAHDTRTDEFPGDAREGG